MLSRGENGKLLLQSKELEIFIGDLFRQCKTEHEVDRLYEHLRHIIAVYWLKQLEEV